ncbi:MAG: c-type cytochrome domain-containing protein [Gemmataceae bacterium]
MSVRPLAPAAAGLLLFAATAPAADKVLFNRDVRPILSEHCFACHGPDAKARKAKLRLDVRDAAIEKGAITPGQVMPMEELVTRVLLAADDEQPMPAAEFHKRHRAQKAMPRSGSSRGRVPAALGVSPTSAGRPGGAGHGCGTPSTPSSWAAELAKRTSRRPRRRTGGP